MESSDISIVPATQEDTDGIREVAGTTGVFAKADMDVVAELLEEYEEEGEGSGYLFRVAKREGKVVGFACYGPTPLTQGTYDLYWIAATQTVHGKGVGTALLLAIETEIIAAGGRLLMIETESTPGYAAARKLYERHGWHLDARIDDFYAPGSDRLIYSKHYR